MNDRILGVGALLLSAFLIAYGYDLHAPFAYEPLGPNAFPLIIAAVIALCGLILVRKGGGQADANPLGANQRIALMFVTLVGYALLFQPLGFILATALMTAVIGRLFGGAWRWTIPSGLILGTCFFWLFDRGMDVVLPTGILGAWL